MSGPLTAANLQLNCRAFIFALSQWSNAYRPLPLIGSEKAAVADKPRVCLTIEWMVAVGIRKILIGATPDDLVRYRKVVHQSSEPEADISYLLLDDSMDISRSILASAEFAAQSNLVVAGAGLHCQGAGLVPRLQSELSRSKGTAAFRMRGRLSAKGRVFPDMLVLDARVRNNLRKMITEQLTDFTELRKFCARNFRYSELDLGDSCEFCDLTG